MELDEVRDTRVDREETSRQGLVGGRGQAAVVDRAEIGAVALDDPIAHRGGAGIEPEDDHAAALTGTSSRARHARGSMGMPERALALGVAPPALVTRRPRQRSPPEHRSWL